MLQSASRIGSHFGKWPSLLLGFATLAILVFTLWLHEPRAHAQEAKGRNPVPVPAPGATYSSIDGKDAGSKDPPMPPMDPAEQRVATIDRLMDQKQASLDATNANIYDLLQVLAECQQNIDALTNGVNNDGLSNLEQHLRQTKPQIRNLKRVMADTRYKIALLAVTADNLDRRIIQLHIQIVHELQPDPSRLLALQKQLETGVNKILSGIDPDDPYRSKELERVGMLRAKMQPRIQAEEAAVLNRAADQAVAAGDWENREHARYLLHETGDLPAQLRDMLLSSPAWRGEL